jgi:hypothetical protein
LAWSTVDCGCEPWLGQTTYYKIKIVATSKLDMHLSKVRTKTGLFGLRIFCLPAGLFQWVIVMVFNAAFHNILGKL